MPTISFTTRRGYEIEVEPPDFDDEIALYTIKNHDEMTTLYLSREEAQAIGQALIDNAKKEDK